MLKFLWLSLPLFPNLAVANPSEWMSCKNKNWDAPLSMNIMINGAGDTGTFTVHVGYDQVPYSYFSAISEMEKTVFNAMAGKGKLLLPLRSDLKGTQKTEGALVLVQSSADPDLYSGEFRSDLRNVSVDCKLLHL